MARSVISRVSRVGARTACAAVAAYWAQQMSALATIGSGARSDGTGERVIGNKVLAPQGFEPRGRGRTR